MPRLARIIVPGLAHHITQRGNRRQRTFFLDSDYADYISLVSEWCERWEVEIWAWCLMPNHAHLIAVPGTCDGLRRAIGEAHRRYTLKVNLREGWQGYLWQGRFRSFVMDERYTLAAARYVELNPVRAGLVERAEDYPWSSARAHLRGLDDGLVKVAPLLERVHDWAAFLGAGIRPGLAGEIGKHVATGRPLGSDEFVERLEAQLGRPLSPQRPGPSPEMRIVSPNLRLRAG
jgi:putative transposase